MKYLVAFSLICYYFLCSTSLHAQQLPVFTQYREHHGYLNPAAINSDFLTHESDLSFGCSYRQQWSGIPGTPTDLLFHGERLLESDGKFHLLVGGHFIKDETDPKNFFVVQGRIAGILAGDPFLGALSIGIAGGIGQKRVNMQKVILVNDELEAMQGNHTSSYPGLNVGIYWHKQLQGDGYFKGDNIFAGFSVPQVLKGANTSQKLNWEPEPHYYASLGFYDFISDVGFIEYSLWLKKVKAARMHADFNVRMKINEWFWFGGGISSTATIHSEIGFMVLTYDNQRLKIGLGFDYSAAKVQPLFGNAVEVNFLYLLNTQEYRQ